MTKSNQTRLNRYLNNALYSFLNEVPGTTKEEAMRAVVDFTTDAPFIWTDFRAEIAENGDVRAVMEEMQ